MEKRAIVLIIDSWFDIGFIVVVFLLVKCPEGVKWCLNVWIVHFLRDDSSWMPIYFEDDQREK
jgi:hypothetical protein